MERNMGQFFGRSIHRNGDSVLMVGEKPLVNYMGYSIVFDWFGLDSTVDTSIHEAEMGVDACFIM